MSVEWAYAKELNCYGIPVGGIKKVRVLARRGKWAWVQVNSKAPFTTLSDRVYPEPIP